MIDYWNNLQTFENWDAHHSFIMSHIKQNDRKVIEKTIQINHDSHNHERYLYK